MKLSALIVSAVALLLAQTSPVSSAETRIDLYDREGRRAGYGVVDRGRIDLFDQKSQRLGYGVVDQGSGRIDLYDTRSNRLGHGTYTTTPGTSYRGSRR